MNPLYVFVIQLFVPLCVGALIAYYLDDVLGRLLLDVCGTYDRARFWMHLTGVMTIVTPVLFSLLLPGFSAGHPATRPSWQQGAWVDGSDATPVSAIVAEVLRHTFTTTLCGVLLSLGVVVWVMVGRIAPANATSKMIDN